MQRKTIAALAAGLLAAVAGAHATATSATPAAATIATPAATAEVPSARSSADQAFEQVQARQADAYRQVLADFDAATRAAPDDVALAVARCEFLDQVTDADQGSWLDAALDDYHDCREGLKRDWPRDPLARLFELGELEDEEAIAYGAPLQAEAEHWPAPLRRRLLARLSELYSDQSDAAHAGPLAVQAARLGEPSRAAEAVEYLVGQRRFAEAEAILRDTPPATVEWQATRRVGAALKLLDRDAARAELLRYRRAGIEVESAIAAQAFLRAGQFAEARRVLAAEDGATAELQQARFDLAVATGDTRTASGLVRITDYKDFAANFQRFAILAHDAPAALLSPRMLGTGLALLLLLGAFALVPGLVLVPVHYRGLVRRLRGRPATPLFPTLGLRHAWIALAAVLFMGLVAAFLIAPRAIGPLLGQDVAALAPGELFRIQFCTIVLSLLLVTRFARLGRHAWVGDRDTLRGAWRVVVAWLALFALGALVGLWNRHTGDTQTVQTRLVDSLVGGGIEQYGLAMTLLLVAVLGPIFEELAYRGMILGGLTHHIGFGWANTLQAALFAASHDDLPRFPFYLAMGLVAGWLVRRSKSLAPAIGLHVLNNAVAVLLRWAV